MKGTPAKAAKAAEDRTAGDVGMQSAIVELIKTSHRKAIIGTSYPIADRKASMFHGSGRSITYGAAVN